MKLVAVTGQKGTGKDTFGNFLVTRHNFLLLKFAGPLKSMLRALFIEAGVPESEIHGFLEGDFKEVPLDILCGKSTRFAMQTLGTEWRDMLGQDLWTNIIDERLSKVLLESSVVITDLRFPHEANLVKKHGGKIVKIVRPGFENASSHASESLISDIDAHFSIINKGTIADLEREADALVKFISRNSMWF